MFNWKKRLINESNERLFELFSENNYINIDAQIFAGNLLYERSYDLDLLIVAKNKLISSIDNDFNLKYYTDPQKIKLENLFVQLLIPTLSILFFLLLYFGSKFKKLDFYSLNLGEKFTLLIIGFIILLPIFRLKKSKEYLIRKVSKEQDIKNNLINKINTELKF